MGGAAQAGRTSSCMHLLIHPPQYGPWNLPRFFGPNRLDAISQGPKNSWIPGLKPLPLAIVMDIYPRQCTHPKHYARGCINHRCINSQYNLFQVFSAWECLRSSTLTTRGMSNTMSWSSTISQPQVRLCYNLSPSGEVMLQSLSLRWGYVTISLPQVRLCYNLSASSEIILQSPGLMWGYVSISLPQGEVMLQSLSLRWGYVTNYQSQVRLFDNLSASGEVMLQSPGIRWCYVIIISQPQVRLFDNLSAAGKVSGPRLRVWRPHNLRWGNVSSKKSSDWGGGGVYYILIASGEKLSPPRSLRWDYVTASQIQGDINYSIWRLCCMLFCIFSTQHS